MSLGVSDVLTVSCENQKTPSERRKRVMRKSLFSFPNNYRRPSKIFVKPRFLLRRMRIAPDNLTCLSFRYILLRIQSYRNKNSTKAFSISSLTWKIRDICSFQPFSSAAYLKRTISARNFLARNMALWRTFFRIVFLP